MSNLAENILIIIIIVIIIILAPILLDFLFKITVRKNKIDEILSIAAKNAKDNNKILIVFDSAEGGYIVDHDNSKKYFKGKFIDTVNSIENNNSVIVLLYCLEYVKTSDVKNVLEKLNSVSNGDLYVVSYEKHSPRTFWDYEIKNIMYNSYYLPNDKILWHAPTKLQDGVQKFYSYIFKVLPYNYVAHHM